MSYELELQSSFPVGFNPLTGTLPPLVAGSGTASKLTTSTPSTLFNGWVKGREDSSFSIEIWALPVTVTAGNLLLIGHTTEGLFYDGTDYILRFDYTGAGVIEGRWTETEIKAHHFVITYDGTVGSLYVDGERVIVLNLPVGDTFKVVASQINLNQSGGTGIYDCLAYYYRVLSVDEIQAHYALGRAISSSVDIASSQGATTWTLTYPDVDVFDSVVYSADTWDLGYFTGTSHSDNLVADSAGGTWQVGIPIGSMVSPTVAGVHLEYVGQRVTMAWSTDAVTWTTVANKTTILEGTTSTDVMLFIRLTLTAADSWVSSLTADVLNSRVMKPFSGIRSLSFAHAEMDETPGNQLEYQNDAGAKIKAGYIDIGIDPNPTPALIQTIAMWARFDATTGWVVGATGSNFVSLTAGALSATGFTMYRNGALFPNGAVPIGEWAYYVFVSTSPLTGPIRIADKLTGGSALDMSVGHLATYDRAFTAADAAATYNANIGATALRVDDVGGLGMSESAPAYDIYAYNWSIVGASR